MTYVTKQAGCNTINPFHTASDIMNTGVHSLNMGDTVKRCLEFMEHNSVRHAVIFQESEERGQESTFVGIVSQRDILRQTLPENKQKGNNKIDPHFLRQMLSLIVVRDPISVDPETDIPDIIETLTNNRISIVPVLNGPKLEGIITTTDILQIYQKLDRHLRHLNPKLRNNMDAEQIANLCSEDTAKKLKLIGQPVENIMVKKIISLETHDELECAINVLNANKFRHILIVDDQQKLAGIISDRDILKHLPFAGKRPTSVADVYTDYLFRVKPHTINLGQSLEKVITTDVKCVLPSTTCIDAATTMIIRRISSLPVVDDDKHILGLVTVTDLVRTLLDLYPRQDSSSLNADASIQAENAITIDDNEFEDK